MAKKIAQESEAQSESVSFEVQEKRHKIARKDWVLHQNEFHFVIKKGDRVCEMGIPAHLMVALKAEEVIY